MKCFFSLMKTLFVFTCTYLLLFSTSFAQQNSLDNAIFSGMNARNIGSATMSGRVAAIDAYHADPRLVYVGAASGGVWKSKNAGITFTPIFDKYTQSIGAITINQQNSDTVWVGTGETWLRNTVSYGDGVYFTKNGGNDWQKAGLEATERIVRIIIHPKNSQIIYVAALGNAWKDDEARGVYKTEDHGATWTKVLYVDKQTGCADLAIDPENPDILYAAMWDFRRKAYHFRSGGAGSALYKTTNGGKSWSMLNNNFPKSILGRIAVSVSPVSPNIVYALVESDTSALYRSENKGQNWTKVNQTQAVAERPFYFSQVIADPIDTNRVWKPGFNLNVSTNGGKNFQTPYLNGSSIHVDHHALYVGRPNNQFLYLGTDGGVYVSNDRGQTWRMARNLPISQFYHVTTDNQTPYNVYGGLQDNGSWTAPSAAAGGITNADWANIGGGDGFNAFPDPENNQIVYWQYQGGNIMRANRLTNEVKEIKPYHVNSSEALRFHWNTPFLFSKDGKRLYTGAQFVFRSKNKGDTWEKISPDLTTNDKNKLNQASSGGLTLDYSTAENHCTVFTIAESPINENIIWAGTDDGNLWVTFDAGKSWVNTSAEKRAIKEGKNTVESYFSKLEGLPVHSFCTSVCPSNFDENTAYATFDNHWEGDNQAYLYKTIDGGKTWKRLTSEVFNSYFHVVKEDLVNKDLIFVGAERGLFVSIDGGNAFAQFTANLPNVAVRDMTIHPVKHDLILATHGRGIYIIDDLTPLRGLTPALLEQDVVMLPIQEYQISSLGNAQRFSGDDEFSGANPETSAQIFFYLKKRHVFGDMYLEILDENNVVLQKLPCSGSKGINVAKWAIRKKAPKVPTSNVLTAGALFGINYPVGTYKVRLTKGSKTYESQIKLTYAKNSTHTAEDRALQYQTATKAYHLLEDLAFLDKNLVLVKEKLTEIKTKKVAVKTNFYEPLLQKITTLRSEILLTKVAQVNSDEKLREKISSIYGAVSRYEGRPTDSQMERLESLKKDFEAKKGEFEAMQAAINVLNEQLKKLNQAPIELISREAFDKE